MTATMTRKGNGKPAAAKAGKGNGKGKAAVLAAANPNTLADLQQPFAAPAADKPGSTAAPAAPAPLDARYVEAPPNAYRTLTALREMGYDSLASVADLVDNCIDADATKIAVQVRALSKGEPRGEGDTGMVIDVLDNGKGMDSATLNQALRLGSDTDHENADLGKYGMGLVTASLGMARSIYVLTRRDSAQAFEATLDVDDVARHNKFLIALAPATDNAKVLDVLGKRGTLVRLTKIDRIDDTNVARFAATLRVKFAQLYRNFIQNGVKLSVNGRLVEAADPLMRDHPETKVVLDTDLEVEGHKFTLTAVELPDLGFAGNQDAGILPHNSGVYVVRNGRQIMAAQTFGMYRHHHSYSGFRAELAFGRDADAMFHVDVMKARVLPDERLLKKLSEVLAPVIAASGKNGRNREVPESAKAVKLDHAADLLNERLGHVTPPPAAAAKGKAAPAGEDKPTGATPNLTTGEPSKPGTAAPDAPPAATIPAGPEVPAEREGKVRWVQDKLPPAKLYSAVEKDGRWLITVNSDHPLTKLVGEARNKAASAVLTYMVFALAAAAKETKGGGEVAEKVGATLASILGTPDA